VAVPFDLASLEITGSPFQVLDGVVTSDGYGSAHFGFSANGTLVYLAGGPESYHYEVSWLARDGTVVPLSIPSRPYGDARVSPDGRHVAWSVLGANAGIWIYELERKTELRLTTHWDNYTPTWSRDGAYVAFGSNQNGPTGIWRARADGSGASERVVETASIAYPASWSPDDGTLAYSQLDPANGSDLWSWSAETGAQPLLQTKFQESSPMISPNGKWLAYVSDESGRAEVYVQAFPAAGRKWRMSVDGGDAPSWSADGRELFYWRGATLLITTVTIEPDFAAGETRVLLETPFTDVLSYDASPDGEHFVVIARALGEGPQVLPSGPSAAQMRYSPGAFASDVNVIVNWFPTLER
jgi:dipeptidyl aminopeptidase/acylaminoacyl peptidase